MKPSILWKPIAAGALLCFCSLSPCVAQIATYSDRSVFDLAVGPTTVEDFTSTDHFPIASGILNSSTNQTTNISNPLLPGDIKPGVTYSRTISGSYFFNIDAGGGFDGGFLDGFTSSAGSNDDPLVITFVGPVAAFGFDTNFLMGSDFDITINYGGSPYVNQNFAVLEGFFGFSSGNQDITSVSIVGNGSPTFRFAVDNFSFTNVGSSAVPEPDSVALLGSVLVPGAAFLIRRRRR